MFKLRKLPFDPKANALISEETCIYHHGKHHQTYINNLNNLIKDTEFEGANLYDILLNGSGGLFNNAAQVYNHDFYWDCIAKKSQMSDELKARLEKDIPNFKEEFLKAATANRANEQRANSGDGRASAAFSRGRLGARILRRSQECAPGVSGKIF